MALAKGGGNPFYSPEEVDDDAFLNHPRAGSTGYMLPQHNSMTSVRYVRISCQNLNYMMYDFAEFFPQSCVLTLIY